MENELTLTLNTAEKRIQFLLSQGDEILCAQDWQAPRNGAELLAPALDDACKRLGAQVADIRKIAAVAGPGSFTGIRLAVTTAAGLARAIQAHPGQDNADQTDAGRVRQAGLDYLQCLAAGVRAKPGKRLCVLVNARRDWVYSGDYVVDENGIPRLQESVVMLPMPTEQIDASPWTSHGDRLLPDYLLGSGLSANRAMMQALYPAEVQLMPPSCDHPSPAALLALTLDVDWSNATSGDIAPAYLRDCDAVDNLDGIARARGQDPARAHAILSRLLTAPPTEME